ncbi:MAG: ABC transporter ATP-binding protein/permease [Butyricicoccus sp.]|nr:ABC transporter ATP-binding protein/permease [Butyricicoccus sp.]
MAENEKRKYSQKPDDAPQAGPGNGPGARGGFQKPKDTKKTIKRLLGYLLHRKLPIAAVLLCLVISTGASLGGTYMLRPIINNLVGSGTAGEKLGSLAASLVTLLLLYLLGCAATYVQSATMAVLAHRAANRLRSDLFCALENLPLKYFDQHTHGELMSRFTNDADNVALAMEQSFVSLISSSLTFVGLVTVMIVTCPPLFAVTALTLFASMMAFKVLGCRSRRFYRKQQAALGQLNGNIQEMIEGLKVVKAFTHEDAAKAEFAGLNEAYRSASTDANFYAGAIMPLAVNIMHIGYALTAMLGGFLALVMGFDLGGFAVYLQYSKQVGQPINQISQQLTALLSALAGAERIFEVMDTPPEPDEGRVTLIPVDAAEDGEMSRYTSGRVTAWAWKRPQHEGAALVHAEQAPDGAWRESPGAPLVWKLDRPGSGVEYQPVRGQIAGEGAGAVELIPLHGDVRLEHVDFSYVTGKRVLTDVSVYAKPGQKIAFVGSTGAGKTTITNLINRFYEIESGRITYDGIDVRDISKDSLRRSLGAVLQDTHLFTGTVMDNIRYGRLEATDEECIAAAKSANAHSFIRRLPNGYDTMLTGDGANLSQGQRQLLAIARAAVADPPVMVLDEATSSIDTRTEQLIGRGMDTLMDGRTVFVIAHRLSTVRNSNCIVVIEHGEIEEKGSHSELVANEGRYFMLYTGQHVLE